VSLCSHTLSTTYPNSIDRITLFTDGCAAFPPIYQHPLARTTRRYPTTPYSAKMRATSALVLLGTGFSAVTTATNFGVPVINALNLRYAVSHPQSPSLASIPLFATAITLTNPLSLHPCLVLIYSTRPSLSNSPRKKAINANCKQPPSQAPKLTPTQGPPSPPRSSSPRSQHRPRRALPPPWRRR
jgi:hypothetical protein